MLWCWPVPCAGLCDTALLPGAAGPYLEVLACRLIVHDVCLAGAVHGVGDLLTGTTFVQADLRHTWQQAQGAGEAHIHTQQAQAGSTVECGVVIRASLQSCTGCGKGGPGVLTSALHNTSQLCMVLSTAENCADPGAQQCPRHSALTAVTCLMLEASTQINAASSTLTNGPGCVAYGQLEVDIICGQVVPVTHVLHQHPQPHLQRQAASRKLSNQQLRSGAGV